MVYMPDPSPDGRLPDRQYFWNVLNTVNSDYVSQLVQHATNLRMTAQQDGEDKDTIEISEEWWNKLNALPFVSRKFAFHLCSLSSPFFLFTQRIRAQRSTC